MVRPGAGQWKKTEKNITVFYKNDQPLGRMQLAVQGHMREQCGTGVGQEEEKLQDWFPWEGAGEAGQGGSRRASWDNCCRLWGLRLPWLSSTWPWGDGREHHSSKQERL